MQTKFISLFVPIYNEDAILEKNISQISETLEQITKSFEIFIIDDNSSDNSGIIGRKISRKNKKINYLRYDNGPSRRENLAKSFKLAKGAIVAYIDIDLATDLSYTRRLFKEIKEGADIAIGSRYIKGAYIKRTLIRDIISRFYKNFMRKFFHSKVRDHQCGFKAFKRCVILDLVKDMGYDKKFVRGWFWDAEMLIRAQKRGYKIVEFPVKWRFGKNSTFNLKRELRMIKYILKNGKYFYVKNKL